MNDYSKIPSPFYRVSLKAIIMNAEKKLLVIQLADGTWEMPGGGWEHGESMQQCLRRELMEELSVVIDNIDFTTMYPYAARGRHNSQSLKLAIPVTLGGEDFVPGDGAVAWKYVTASELAQLEMVDAEAGIKSHIDRMWQLNSGK